MSNTYTNICPVPRSHWFGRETMCVYNQDNERVLTVLRWTGTKYLSKEECVKMARKIAQAMTDYEARTE